MKLYWRNCGWRHGNFGDELTPLIVAALSKQKIERAEAIEKADVVAIGSIISEIPGNYEGDIWGTGSMWQGRTAELPHADIHAVRGPLTAARFCRGKPAPCHGDPALLCERLLQPKPEPEHDLGVLPHYVDMNDTVLAQFCKLNPGARLIDPCAGALRVLAEIARCRYLVSSGLHGLVVADALDIPNGWIQLGEHQPGDRLAGGTFKFRDYYACYGITDPVPVSFWDKATEQHIIEQLLPWKSRAGIGDIKQRLADSFPKEWR